MDEPNFYERTVEALKIYFKYVRRIHAIVYTNNIPHKKRIADLKMLMVNFSEDLLDAENKFLDTQFPLSISKIDEAQEKFMAGPICCSIILN